MKVIKKTKDYVVYQKGSGRYAVKDAERNWVNADEKIKILLAEGLIKAVMPAAKSSRFCRCGSSDACACKAR